MKINFYSNDIDKIAFSGIKSQKGTIKKAIKSNKCRTDYSQFDPYFLRILIDEGCSVNEIAHDIGKSIMITRNILKHFGLKTQLSMLLDAIKPEELKKLLDAKKSQKEIAEHFMIDDVAALTPLIKKVGGKTATKAKVDSIPKEDLQKLADDGLSYERIGKLYQVAAKFIINRMNELGIKTKQKLAREKTITLEKIKHYIYGLNWSTQDISEKTGISAVKICKIMKDNNIKTPKRQKIEKIPSKEEFIEARMVCNSLKEYMEKLCIGANKAKKYMAEYNIKPFHVVIKDPTDILELLKKNPKMSVDEIARELDLPPRSIDAAISKFKIPIMHTSNFVFGFISADTAKKFNANIAMGDTPTQLGEQFGLSRNRIIEIADSLNDYRTSNLKYSPYYENYLVKNYDLSTCKPSPDKETVENCIKKIGGSWSQIQDSYHTSYTNYDKKIHKILKKLQISKDTLDYLIKKYNIV